MKVKRRLPFVAFSVEESSLLSCIQDGVVAKDTDHFVTMGHIHMRYEMQLR
jgi:hypothetical protein